MGGMKFSKWVLFKSSDKQNYDRKTLPGIDLPGIYVLAISQKDISGDSFEWIEEIKYIGMTNSKNGLKGRLQQFENTMRGMTGHGGARRFRNDYSDYKNINNTLFKKLYVSVAPFGDVVVKDDNPPEVLRTMGDVAKAEYECFALYREKIGPRPYGPLPKYNDKKNSEKYYD